MFWCARMLKTLSRLQLLHFMLCSYAGIVARLDDGTMILRGFESQALCCDTASTHQVQQMGLSPCYLLATCANVYLCLFRVLLCHDHASAACYVVTFPKFLTVSSPQLPSWLQSLLLLLRALADTLGPHALHPPCPLPAVYFTMPRVLSQLAALLDCHS